MYCIFAIATNEELLTKTINTVVFHLIKQQMFTFYSACILPIEGIFDAA